MKWYYLLFGLQTMVATAIAAWMLYRWDELYGRLAAGLGRDLLRIISLAVVFYTAFMPGNLGWNAMGWFYTHPVFAIGAYIYIILIAVITHFLHRIMAQSHWYRSLGTTQAALSFLVIALCPFLLDAGGQQLLGYPVEEKIKNVSYSLLVGCCAGLVALFLRFYSQKKELRERELLQHRAEAELKALQSRIHPHFLYNSLSGLAGLALEDGRRASRMATELSHLFRYLLNKEQGMMSTVAEEVDMAETYLNIEKIRFEEKLLFTIAVDDACRPWPMPRFVLQPLLENCLKHAFVHMRTPGTIDVEITCSHHQLQIIIADNGQPFPQEAINGFGLGSIRQQLALLYPGRHSFSLENAPVKRAIITLTTATH